MALAFYQSDKIKKEFIIAGVILSVGLHAIFNLLIIKSDNDGDTFFVFLSVWLVVAVLLVVFEKVKSLAKKYY